MYVSHYEELPLNIVKCREHDILVPRPSHDHIPGLGTLSCSHSLQCTPQYLYNCRQNQRTTIVERDGEDIITSYIRLQVVPQNPSNQGTSSSDWGLSMTIESTYYYGIWACKRDISIYPQF